MTYPCDEQVAPSIIVPDWPESDCDCAKKQDKLTAGKGITIEDNVISAEGESYEAGVNIDITDGVISAPDVYSKTEVDDIVTSYATKNELDAVEADLEERKQDKLTKQDILDLLGYEEVSMTITDINSQIETKTIIVKKEG